MSRAPAITLNDVADAVSQLLSKGEKPTIAKVREVLGNKGSPNTISKLLKELKSGSAPGEKPEAPAEEAVKPEPTPKPKKSEFEPDTAEFDAAQAGEIKIEFGPAESATPELKPKLKEQPRDNQPKQVHSKPRQESDRRQDQSHKQKDSRHQGHHQQHNGHGHNHNNQNQQRREKPRRQVEVKKRPSIEMETEVYESETLEGLSQEQLVSKVRRLETILNKEQFRRESAEIMARQAKEYAETIKQQVSARINDVKESSDAVIENLKSQIKLAEQNAERDLRFYREHLAKAAKRIEDSSS